MKDLHWHLRFYEETCTSMEPLQCTKKIFTVEKIIWGTLICFSHAGYTPQDNRADFGPISPLPTILGNVLIILVVLKIVFSDFSVV